MVPKITDFGLAKLYKDSDTPTRPGEVIGTPNYMAPEQAAGQPDGVSPAADIYSLGAVLYELLTGEPPFHGGSPMEILMRVRLSNLVPPRYYAPQVPVDLETICLKCLRKDRNERYASAAALAEDLDRFLAGRPILARPVGRAEQVWKWSRRRPTVATLSVLLALLFIGANSVIVYQWRSAVDAREDVREKLKALESFRRKEIVALRGTEAARAAAERKQYAIQLLAAETEWLRSDAAAARLHLQACQAERRGWEWHYLNRLVRGSEVTIPTQGKCVALHVLPDNKEFFAIGSNGVVTVRALATGATIRSRPLAREAAIPGEWVLTRAEFSRDGNRVIAVLTPPPGANPQTSRRIGVWEVTTGHLIRTWTCTHGDPLRVAFSPNGQHVAWVSGVWTPTRGNSPGNWQGGEVRIVNVSAGTTLLEKVTPSADLSFLDVTFGPGGTRIVLTRRNLALLVLDAKTGDEVIRAGVTLEGRRVWSLPNRTGYAVLCGHQLRFFDRDGKLLDSTISRKQGGIDQAYFSPDGERIVSANAFNTVRVWDTGSRQELLQLAGHVNWVPLAAIAPDNRRLVTCSLDGTIKVWNLEQALDPPALGDGEYTEGVWIPALAFDGTGSRLFAGSDDHKLRAYDLDSGKKIDEWTVGDARTLSLSPDGATLAIGFDDEHGNLGLFDLASGKMRHQEKAHDDCLTHITFSANGGRFATASEDGTAKVWDAATGRLDATFKGHMGNVNGVAIYPDGQQAVTAGADGTVRFWDMATGAETRRIAAHGSAVTCVAISPDGRWLATANANRDQRAVSTEIKIWNPHTGELLQTMAGHVNSVWHLAFSPDSSRLASGGEDTTVKIWDPAHGDLLLTLKGHTDDVRCVVFSRDGNRLASSGDDPFLRVWDATPQP